MPDRYTYSGTEVLVNRRDITDFERLRAVETAVVGQRMAALRHAPIAGSFDLPHLQAVHRYLMSPLFDWAGQLRTTDTGPGGTGIAHCRPEFILPESERVFALIRDAHYLRGLDRQAFSATLATVWGEATALHPFRDGNTRSQWVFFTQLSEQAGWVIDWGRIDVRLFAHARTVAITRDSDGIDALLYPALRTTQQAQQADATRDRIQHDLESFFPGRDSSPLTPAELNTALQEALERRRQELAPSDSPDSTHTQRRDNPGLTR
jgi:cell filamentation protein